MYVSQLLLPISQNRKLKLKLKDYWIILGFHIESTTNQVNFPAGNSSVWLWQEP